MSDKDTSEEPSPFRNLIDAVTSGLSSPSEWAQIAVALAHRVVPSGAEDTAARLLQAGVNGTIAFSRDFMAGVIRQYGTTPSPAMLALLGQR